MNPAVISAVLVAIAAGAGSQHQADASAGAARAALLAPQGFNVTITCPQLTLPTFPVRVAERDGKLFAQFPRCESALQEAEAGVFRGAYCGSQPFQWVYQPGDPVRNFKGTGGRMCAVELARR